MKQARTAREERENLRKNGEPLEKTLELQKKEQASRKGLDNLRKRSEPLQKDYRVL